MYCARRRKRRRRFAQRERGCGSGFAFGSATTLALKVDVGSDGSTLSENRREQGKFPYQIVAPSSCAWAVRSLA